MWYSPQESKTCALCRGQGKVDTFFPLFMKMCAACGGQGSVLVIAPARSCAYCSGCGRVNHLFDHLFVWRCPSCNGTGWAHVVKR